MATFFNFMLPDTLKYKLIDQDDEASVALGRARLANATASAQYIEQKIFTPGEMRRQAISDGLVTISVPEDVPEDEFPEPDINPSPVDERPGSLGKPVAPSQGGHGEVLPRGDVFSDAVYEMVNVPNAHIRKLVRSIIRPLQIETNDALDKIENDAELLAWSDWYDETLWGDLNDELPELTLSTLDISRGNLESEMLLDDWWKLDVSADDVYDEFQTILTDAILEEFGAGYINGEIKSKFKVELALLIEHINDSLLKDIQNCLISGTKKSLLDKELIAKSLDEDGIISDNKTVEYVRHELLQLGEKLIRNFAVQLSDTINNILGDV
jgi:hypothetical protein